MKNFSISLPALALALSAGSVLAADFPAQKAPPVAAPAPTWAGFYAGLNVGGGWSAGRLQYGGTLYRSSTNGPQRGYEIGVPSWANASNFSGVIGGGQIGYNHQLTPWFTTGLEADFQGTSLSGQSSAIGAFPRSGRWSPIFGAATTSQSIEWFGTVRGRLGVTPLSAYANLLMFATGGFAYGGVNSSNTVSNMVISDSLDPSYGVAVARSNKSAVRTGWTVGGGLEWSPTTLPSWSFKVEYLYTELGAVRNAGYGIGPTTTGQRFMTNAVSTTNAYRFNLVRAGMNYHFSWDAAPSVVAAK